MTEEFDGVIGIVFQRSDPVKYLLIHNRKTGNISLPAGGRESGETSSKETLKREIQEETGLLPSEYAVIETSIVHEFVYNSKKKERAGQTAKQPVYLIETQKNDLKSEDSDSKIEGWFTSEEVLDKLSFSDSKKLFEKAISSLNVVEQIIEVDIDDNRIGVRPRDDFFRTEHIHRAAHLILFNSKNEILLQFRAASKKVWPNMFTFSVDCTVAVESYEDCIRREMQEEIGITISAQKLFTFPYFDDVDKAWHCVFVGKSDETITPDPREIQEIKWIDAAALKEDLLKNPDKYVPPFIEGMKRYFDEFYDSEC